jgi:hypothetical protein
MIITRCNFVSIFVAPDQRNVRLVAQGVMIEREFPNHDLKWASGQRIGLNLTQLTYPIPDECRGPG